jgi:protein TilB
MVILDENLLRKRSEHHEGLLVDLEEVALHQEEIEKIESIGRYCRHLKILLLQNNIISKIENVNKLKELEYLNLAMNNINKIQNLERVESLRKLDLTMNFIDFDELESSVNNLSGLWNLEDLYLIGNPVETSWKKTDYRLYVIGRLPQLKQLDGQLITFSEREAAEAALSRLADEVSTRAKSVMARKKSDKPSDESETSYSQASRLAMYRELGEQKAAKELAEKRRLGIPDPQPPKEPPSVLNARGEIRQCNEGGYKYALDEYSYSDRLIFELHAPKYMDSSFISIDLDPRYVRCVIRNKVTQVRFDSEISVARSTVERSRTTGIIKCVCFFENFIPRNFFAPESVLDVPPPLTSLT